MWYRGLTKYLKERLQCAQNKMLRLILSKHNRFHLDSRSFEKVKWLDVCKRNDYLTLCLMYNIFHKTAPSYMCSFKRIDDFHNHATRYSEISFVIPQVKSQGLSSFSFNGVKLWNSLPLRIKSADSKDAFKHMCKKHLFSKMIAQENCSNN